MHIKNVKLIGFGRFGNREITFANDLSIIYGSNEAGKTTVVDAIAGVFYGFKGRREEQKQLRQRYSPWHTDGLYKAGVTIFAEDLGTLYIERDFSTNKAEVRCLNGDVMSPAGITVDELAARYFGAANLQLFKSTMLIRQEEIAVLAREEISTALSRKIISTEQTTSLRSVFNSLGKKYLELNRGLIRSTGNHGPIRNCLDEINSLEEELRAVDSLSADYGALTSEAEQLEEAVYALKSRLAEISPVVANYRKYSEIKRQRDHLFDSQKEIQSKLDKIREKTFELKNIEDSLQDREMYSEYLSDAVRRRLDSLDKELDGIREKLSFNEKNNEHYIGLRESLQKDLEHETRENDVLTSYKFTLDRLIEAERLSGQISELEKELAALDKNDSGRTAGRNKPRRRLLPTVGAVIGLSSLAGLFVGGVQGYALASLLFFAGLTIFVLGLAQYKPHSGLKVDGLIGAERERIEANLDNYRKMLDKLTSNLDMEEFRIKVNTCEESRKKVFALKKQLSEIDMTRFLQEKALYEEEYARVSSEMKGILAATGAATPEDYRQLCREYREQKRERDWLRDSIRQALGGYGEEELRKELSVLGVKIHNLQAEMDMFNCGVSQEEFVQLAREEQEKLGELDSLEKELIRVRTGLEKFEQYALQGKDRWTLENRLTARKSELKSLEIRKKGIMEAVRFLREAVREAQADLVPQVSERAAEIMAEITGGKYGRLELTLDASGIAVKTVVAGSPQAVDAGHLSTGTRDQVYLALRVAIAEYVAGRRRCPLILDDPFVNFDADRLSLTINLLKALSADRQVILLTKDMQYVRQCPEIAVSLED